MKKRIWNILSIALFGAALLAVPVGWLCNAGKTFSESERRYLAELPKLSKQSLSDWTFDDATETYLADHLPLRDALVGVNAYATLASGRQVSTDVWADDEGYLLEAPVRKDSAEIQKRMKRIAALAETTGVPTYVLAVPSAGYIRRSHLPGALAALYKDDAILGEIAASETVTFVPLLDRFEREGQGWYYRTDHHWTADGAFAAYEAFAAASGRTALSKDAFYHHSVNGYYGSTRSRSALWLTAPDTLRIDEPIGADVTVSFSDSDTTSDRLFFYEHLGEYDWYPLFLDGNHAITVIENHAAPEDAGTLLMVKDSFGNTLVPLLVSSYRSVVMVDPRYCRESVSQLCKTIGADEILFCYSLERIATDLNLLRLK